MTRTGLWVATMFVAAACTKPNPDYCGNNGDCHDASRPYCDVNGDFGDTTNTCIATPRLDAALADAPLDSARGLDAPHTHDAQPDAGLPFQPSHGLGSALADASSEPDITIPTGSTLDTDTGIVLDPSSHVIVVKTEVIAQSGAPSIRVMIGHSFSIGGLAVSGSNALAFVATEEIHVSGRIGASAHGDPLMDAGTDGPGSFRGTNTCEGAGTKAHIVNGNDVLPGAGGGGNGMSGGAGGPTRTLAGGSPGQQVASDDVLMGGCAGGSADFGTGSSSFVSLGGGGGGAVQLDSLASVLFDGSGGIIVNGAGGFFTALGGGAGGTVVIEAPALTISGANTEIAANGGGGGACDAAGSDGGLTTAAASAPACQTIAKMSGGHGGTIAASAGSALDCNTTGVGCGSQLFAGAGGGAPGRLLIATETGDYQLLSGPTISAIVTATTLP